MFRRRKIVNSGVDFIVRFVAHTMSKAHIHTSSSTHTKKKKRSHRIAHQGANNNIIIIIITLILIIPLRCSNESVRWILKDFFYFQENWIGKRLSTKFTLKVCEKKMLWPIIYTHYFWKMLLRSLITSRQLDLKLSTCLYSLNSQLWRRFNLTFKLWVFSILVVL